MTYTESKEIRSVSDELIKIYDAISGKKNIDLKQISSTMIALAMQLHELIRVNNSKRGKK